MIENPMVIDSLWREKENLLLSKDECLTSEQESEMEFRIDVQSVIDDMIDEGIEPDVDKAMDQMGLDFTEKGWTLVENKIEEALHAMTAMDKLKQVQKELEEKYGLEFHIDIKVHDAKQNLSREIADDLAEQMNKQAKHTDLGEIIQSKGMVKLGKYGCEKEKINVTCFHHYEDENQAEQERDYTMGGKGWWYR